MSQLNAAVIGLGRIGQGYDYDSGTSGKVLTHASAFAAHPRIRLVAGLDPSPVERERFSKKFAAPAFADLDSLLAHGHVEIFALCVPTKNHFEVFKRLIASRPRAIICEKPITTDIRQAVEMIALAKAAKCALLVNYIRRFEPGTLALIEAIRNGRFGEIYKGVVWYSKGILNNGSHFIDLLCLIFGSACSVEFVRAGRNWDADDPEPDCCLRFGNTSIYLLAAREEHYSHYTMELIGTKGMVNYLDGGASIKAWLAPADTAAPRKAEISFPSSMHLYQQHVTEALVNHLDSGLPLASDGSSALETLRLVQTIVNHKNSQLNTA